MAEEKKRIMFVMPSVSEKWNDNTRELLNRYVSPGFEVNLVNVKYGGIESIPGLVMAVTLPYIIHEILEAAQEGYDAIIPNCCSDPGVAETRSVVNVPVVGPAESALHIACTLGYRIGIIEVGGTPPNWAHQLVKKHGLSDRLASVRSVALAVEDCGDAKLTLDALHEASLKAVEQDRAEVLVFGCTGLTGYAEELQRRLDIPVVEPSLAALKMAEVLIAMNLKHSRLAFPLESAFGAGAGAEVKYPPTLKPYS